ncbi:hypothetical protein [Acidipila rosea]|uniref:hypothetical protein n=1 Tax=Acidipila rosea TaxID=768535 RepID=UPI0010494CC4|nr:hypothetical protein [Acidipila rosea]MBW4028492.1 hypothetical protein [Acidobacteriota bacterium]MBW4045881.1 hypothetical protein [Acidobacteriota bacterium]
MLHRIESELEASDFIVLLEPARERLLKRYNATQEAFHMAKVKQDHKAEDPPVRSDNPRSGSRPTPPPGWNAEGEGCLAGLLLVENVVARDGFVQALHTAFHPDYGADVPTCSVAKPFRIF